MRSLSATIAVALLASTGALLLTGCNDHLVTFTFEEKSQEQVVEGRTLPNPDIIQLPYDPFTFDIDLEKQLEKRDTGPAKKVFLKGLKFKVTDTKMQGGDSDDFDFLESITFRADAEGKKEKKVAWKNEVPDGKQSFKLQVDDSVNLKPYVEKGMKLKTEASGKKPEDDTSMRAIIPLQVKAL